MTLQAGDGIGPEVINAALIVLRRIAAGARSRGAPICGDDHEFAWYDVSARLLMGGVSPGRSI
jgi:isocitrate/isopropylmalate dehydrogenase